MQVTVRPGGLKIYEDGHEMTGAIRYRYGRPITPGEKPHQVDVFTTDGTWVKPTNVTAFEVLVAGGEGGHADGTPGRSGLIVIASYTGGDPQDDGVPERIRVTAGAGGAGAVMVPGGEFAVVSTGAGGSGGSGRAVASR